MGYGNIIGRKDEINTLERRCNSNKSEFIAIYGRRRVGKSIFVSQVLPANIHATVRIESRMSIS